MKALPEFGSGPLQTALLPASNGDQRADVTIRLQTHRDGSCPRVVLLPQTSLAGPLLAELDDWQATGSLYCNTRKL